MTLSIPEIVVAGNHTPASPYSYTVGPARSFVIHNSSGVQVVVRPISDAGAGDWISVTGNSSRLVTKSDEDITQLDFYLHTPTVYHYDLPGTSGDFVYSGLARVGIEASPATGAELAEISGDLQGYYGLQTDWYFDGGVATDTVIPIEDVNQFVDVNFTIAAEGLYDKRTNPMKEASAVGHTGAGTPADPFIFKLEGLTVKSTVVATAALAFVPDDDEGQLETRLNFFRAPSLAQDNFQVSDITLNMDQGADDEYVGEASLSFFCDETIATVGPGDAGSFCFQFRSSVAGTLSLRALTLYITQ